MIFEERTKLYTPLLQLDIHVYFEFVDDIFNPPENGEQVGFASQFPVHTSR